MQKLGQNDLAHDQRHVVTISSDSFYRILNVEERERAKLGEFDFDHPGTLLVTCRYSSGLGLTGPRRDGFNGSVVRTLFRDWNPTQPATTV